MWHTLFFLGCALVLVVVVAHESYRLGAHRGYAEGKRDGWNAYAAQRQEAESANRAIANESTLLLRTQRRGRGRSS